MKLTFHDFEIDPTRFEIRRAGILIPVPRLVFDLISYLIHHRDRPVTKKELFENVWSGRIVTEASLTQAVTAARRTLRDSPTEQRVIRTVHGRGYWWVAETGLVGSTAGGPRLSEGAFVGREVELRLLESLWEKAEHRSGGLALVLGEPGLGKTRLVQAIADRVRGTGPRVVWAFGDETRPTPPMSIWSQVVSGLDEGEVISTRPVWDAIVAQEQDRRAENLGEARVALDTRRSRALDSIVSTLRSADRGLLVAIDDLHRADTASLQTLLAVSSRLHTTRVLIVATLRPLVYVSEESVSDLLVALMSKSNVALLSLQPLSMQQVADLVRSISGDLEGTDWIWERSGGNPFFVDLLARFASPGPSAPSARAPSMPTALASAIAARCDEMPDEPLALLRVASVLGLDFTEDLLGSLVGRGRQDVADCLDQACQAGFVRPLGGGSYRFRHAILRDALYGQLGAARRTELHYETARCLERHGVPESLDRLAEIAHHYAEGAPAGDPQKALTLLGLCGDRALARMAPDDAAAFFSRALDVGRRTYLDQTVEIELMRRLGEAFVLAGRRSEGRAALLEAAERARALGDLESVGRSALALAPGLLSIETGEIDVALVDLLESAVATPDDGSTLRVELIGRLALALYWRGEDDRRSSRIAQLDVASRRLTDTDDCLRASLYQIAASWGPHSHEQRCSRLRELEAKGGPRAGMLRSVLRVFAVTSTLEAGEWVEARRQLALLEAELKQTRDPLAAWYPPMYRAMLALADGRVVDAEALVGLYSQSAGAVDDKNLEHCVAAQVGELCWLRGHLDLAVSGVEALVSRFPGMPEWRCVWAFFLAVAGRTEEAVARVYEVLAGDHLRLAANMNFVLATCALAEAVVRTGLTSEASRIRTALRPYAARCAVAGFGVVSWGSVARYVGGLDVLRGDWAEAEASLKAALESDWASGSAMLVARSELAIGEFLSRRRMPGDDCESRRWVTSARDRIRGRGLVQLESDAARIEDSLDESAALSSQERENDGPNEVSDR